MTIEKAQNGDALSLKVSGRLDTVTAPQLSDALTASLEGAQSLRLDFSELEYISSAGLRVLLQAQKTMQKRGGMVVSHPNETVMEVLDVTGFSDILTIEK